MSLQRGMDGSHPARAQPVTRMAGTHEERRVRRSWVMASGTLACPACDAPVAPAGAPLGPADAIGCPYCGHAAAVRDFLSLSTPGRPARVAVRVVERPRAA